MTFVSMCRCLPLALLFALSTGLYPDAASAEGTTTKPEGTLSEGRYEHRGLGWRFAVPPGWNLMSEADIARHTGKGTRVVERSLGAPIEQRQIDLLYLEHGRATKFTSVRQRIRDEDGPLAEQQEALFEVVAQAYRDSKIPIRTERESETIDGVSFQVLHVDMLSKDRKKVAVQQYMYSGQVGPDDLVVSITSADDDDLETGLTAWRGSTFDRAARTADSAAKH